MALKSKEWFYKMCLQQIEDQGPFEKLSWDLLKKGIGQEDSTRGHVGQAVGACQRFLKSYPHHKATIRTAPPDHPFDVASYPNVEHDLQNWMSKQHGKYGRQAFGYSFDTQRGYLTPKLGGRRHKGGGGNDEFKKVLRLIAEFDT